MHATLASPFYTSGTFWAAIAALAAVATAVITFVRRSPKQRRLTYRLEAIPLLHGETSMDIEIRRNGVLLEEPHLVQYVMSNPSRQDIGSDAFDQGTPITVEFGALIVEYLGGHSDPASSVMPRAEVKGTKLRVLPGRFGRGDTMTYRALTAGRPAFEIPRHQLLQVRLEEALNLPGKPPYKVLLLMFTVLTAALTVVLVANDPYIVFGATLVAVGAYASSLPSALGRIRTHWVARREQKQRQQ